MIHEYPEVFARFYDVIYHHHRDGVDNSFFLNEIKNCKGKVLDIGVGTGRFFIDAMKINADIYGIDISEPMTRVLKSKLDPHQHYRVSTQNIIDFSFPFQFDLIIAPFRVLMHVLEKDDQIRALNNVCKHLNPNGKFIFDTFVPNLNQLINGMDNQVDFDGEYEKGMKLRRVVSTKPDLINQIIDVSFRFEWDEGKELKTEIWSVPLRFFFRYELEHLVERTDFKNYKIFGDYSMNMLNKNSKEFIVECIKM